MNVRIRLETPGLLVLATGLSLVAVGVLADNAIIALWGQVVLGLLALAWPLTLRAALRVTAGGLVASYDAPEGPGGALIAGAPFELPVRLENRTRHRIPEIALRVATSQGVRLDAEETLVLDLAGARARVIRLQGRAVRVGPSVIYGTHLRVSGPVGLFGARVYQPGERQANVLPRTAASRPRSLRLATLSALREALSPSSRPVRGLGSDIRELRNHVHGDPYKHIAWKATARARRLIVREFESEVSLSVYAALDIGAAMRAGPPGETALDRGIDLVFHIARALADGRDRFGLVTFDDEVFAVTRGSSAHHLPQQVMGHLLELHAVVAEGFTEPGVPDALVATVGEFFRDQEGVELSMPEVLLDDGTQIGPWDDDAVVERARAWLNAHPDEQRAWLHRVPEPSDDPRQSVLRTWCRLRGVELPYQVEALPSARRAGIEAAVQRAIHDRGGPHTIVVVSDLAGIDDADAVLPAIRLCRAHRHRLIFVVPDLPPPSDSTGATGLEGTLVDLFREADQHRRQRVAAGLRARGCPVIFGADPARLAVGARHAVGRAEAAPRAVATS